MASSGKNLFDVDRLRNTWQRPEPADAHPQAHLETSPDATSPLVATFDAAREAALREYGHGTKDFDAIFDRARGMAEEIASAGPDADPDHQSELQVDLARLLASLEDLLESLEFGAKTL
jgi:hypothetical protein